MPMDTFDALSAARELRQILNPDKLSLGFLIGAGCPSSIKVPDGSSTRPLIPDVAGLTKRIAAALSDSVDHKNTFTVLLDGLHEDGMASPNVEHYLTRVRSLHDVAGNSTARGLSQKELMDLDKTICALISEAVDCRLPSTQSPFHDLASFIGARRTTHVELFTTNYDLLIEEALENKGVPFFDGFCGSNRAFFDQRAIEGDLLPSRWARLRKLHGSINWRLLDKQVIRTRETTSGAELLIHPSHRKYDDSRRMPYLVMMDRLRAFIRHKDNPVCLFINGYSWADEHLNEAIVDGLADNPKAVCLSIQRSEIAKYTALVALATRTPNLTIYAKDAAVVGQKTRQWTVRPTADVTSLKGIFEAVSGAGDAPVPGTFLLGDFMAFGRFLSTFSSADVAAG